MSDNAAASIRVTPVADHRMPAANSPPVTVPTAPAAPPQSPADATASPSMQRRNPWPPAFLPAATRIAIAQALLPAAILIAIALLAHYSGLDLWLADRLFAAQGQQWVLRQHVLTSTVLHSGGRLLSQLAWAGVAVAWLLSRRIEAWRPWQCALGRLALSVLLSVALIATMKQLIPVHCPRDLLRYGGDANIGDGGGVCFPAGHASAGYAWMALARVPHSARWRRVGLAIGIVAGLVFGLDQQLRGAHFLSHDLWTAALCWTVAVLVSPTRRGAAA